MVRIRTIPYVAAALILGSVVAQEGWCQSGFGGLRSRHTGGSLTSYRVGGSFTGSSLSSFMADSQQFRSSANSYRDLRSNRETYSNSLRSGVGGLPRFGASSPQSRGLLAPGGLSQVGMSAFPGSVGWGGPGSYSAILNSGAVGEAPLIQMGNAASPAGETIDPCREFQMQCVASGEEALRPIMEKYLQRPSLAAGAAASSEAASDTASVMSAGYAVQAAGTTTPQGALFIAQQMSRARDYIRQGKYDQAINFYQAAQTIDSRNINAIIGTTYCHIMTGKFQAGGLGVLALVREAPDFWIQPPDYGAVVGITAATVAQRFEEIEPLIDRVFRIYRPEDGKQVAEDLKLAYLSRMFMAWLKGDDQGVRTNILAAARAAPLDAPVQQLSQRITGTGDKEQIQLKPIKPVL